MNTPWTKCFGHFCMDKQVPHLILHPCTGHTKVWVGSGGRRNHLVKDHRTERSCSDLDGGFVESSMVGPRFYIVVFATSWRRWRRLGSTEDAESAHGSQEKREGRKMFAVAPFIQNPLCFLFFHVLFEYTHHFLMNRFLLWCYNETHHITEVITDCVFEDGPPRFTWMRDKCPRKVNWKKSRIKKSYFPQILFFFSSGWVRNLKTRMLGSIVSRLASPTAHWRKIWGENFLSTQDGIKHPEMHKKWKWEKMFGGEKKFGWKKS